MSRFCVAVLGKGQPFPADCALPGLICEALKYNELLTHHTSKGVHGELLFKLPRVTGIAHGNEISTGIGRGQHGGGWFRQ